VCRQANRSVWWRGCGGPGGLCGGWEGVGGTVWRTGGWAGDVQPRHPTSPLVFEPRSSSPRWPQASLPSGTKFLLSCPGHSSGSVVLSNTRGDGSFCVSVGCPRAHLTEGTARRRQRGERGAHLWRHNIYDDLACRTVLPVLPHGARQTGLTRADIAKRCSCIKWARVHAARGGVGEAGDNRSVLGDAVRARQPSTLKPKT
jgi:hypothetical protein